MLGIEQTSENGLAIQMPSNKVETEIFSSYEIPSLIDAVDTLPQ